MANYTYDLVVIGSGPAGESAAMTAIKRGWSVAVIDSRKLVGGNCTHLGTIPSKALRHAVWRIMEYNQNPLFRMMGEPKWFSFPEVMEVASNVISEQVNSRTRYYSRNRIALHHGWAHFEDANTLVVKKTDGRSDTLATKFVLIATGSRPYQPDDIDFSNPRILDSDSVLALDETPSSVIIYGAGVIGCEYASIFSGLDIKVDLVNTRDRLLSFMDDEISDALSYHLRDEGVMVRHDEEYDSVKANAKGVTVKLKSGKVMHADYFLFCNGRTGNTDQLQVKNAGLEADHRGQLKVSHHYQTSVPNIYAAGDVIGWPSLAGAAADQGRFAALHMAGDEDQYAVEDVATGIYTIPEISFVGKNERELTKEGVPYEVGRAFFKSIARAQISGKKTGVLKILFHAETLEVLGVHCFGAEAAEIVHIGQAIMNQEGKANDLRYFTRTTFNYPTMAEAYRVAALNGLNRLHRDRNYQ